MTVLDIKSIGSEVDTVNVQIGPQFLNLFSRQLYSSSNKAFEELISNSWDADAENVYVNIPADLNNSEAKIWILDDGISMDVSGFKDLWSVATSKKRNPEYKAQRKPIGKFGVGKLATYLLANELTYICKASDGKIRAVTMDYRDIDDERNKEKLHIDALPLPVREISLEEVKGLLPDSDENDELYRLLSEDVPDVPKEDYVDEFGGVKELPSDREQTWTLAILSELKDEGAQLKLGWIKHLLKTSLPLGDSIRISVNGETIVPKKVETKVTKEWKLGQDYEFESITVEGEEITVTHHEQPYPHILLDGIGEVTGTVRLFSEKISGGKSDLRESSNGFIVNVLGRNILPEDPYFGLENLSHSTWASFRCAVRADYLDGKISVDREGVAASRELLATRAILMRFFNDARSAANRAVQESWPTEGDAVAGRIGERMPFQPLERLVEEYLVDVNDTPDFIDAHQVENAAEFRKMWREEIIGTPEKLVRKTTMAELEPSEKLVRYDVAQQEIVINKSHPFSVEYSDNPEQLRMLQDTALVEFLTDTYMLDSGLPEDRLTEISDYRDRMLRLVATLRRRTAPQIVKLLGETTDHVKGFEVIVGDALDYLGFVVDRMGQSGKPEGVASAIISREKDEQKQDYKLTYDAKSTIHKRASAGNVGVSGLARHKKDFEADYALVVARDFATGALQKECAENGVTPMTAETLGRLVSVTLQQGPLDLRKLKPLFELNSPDETTKWVEEFEKNVNHDQTLTISVIMQALAQIVSKNPKLPDVIHATQIAATCREILGNDEFPQKGNIISAMRGLQLMVPNVVSANMSGDVYLLTTPKKIGEALQRQLDAIPEQYQKGDVSLSFGK
ncbi:ATP-binding protein [uncultured Ruegeria sp.]|uniref:ATP-binding protein n=1 Tax=uncultured Ruegeria sp. TaxID=259304 RepID=UPI002624C1BC|nr:ATP-binding protein [uncultured Ruegeria sp.]